MVSYTATNALIMHSLLWMLINYVTSSLYDDFQTTSAQWLIFKRADVILTIAVKVGLMFRSAKELEFSGG